MGSSLVAFHVPIHPGSRGRLLMSSEIGLPAGSATVRDLYAQKDLGPSTDSYTATSVPSHGIVMLKVTSST